jgi:hypothetical protein
VVRQRVPPKEVPAHLIPRLMRGVEAQEWFKKTKKKSSKDDMGKGYMRIERYLRRSLYRR